MLRLLVPAAALALIAAVLPPEPAGDETARAKELLKRFEGAWITETVYGNFPPSQGSEEVKLMSHGLSAVVTSSSPMGPGMTFEGHGLLGYDPAQKKWIQCWIDNTDTSVGVSEGAWSADGKVFTIEEEIDMGGGPKPTLLETRFADDGSHSFRMIAKDAAADAKPMLTMTYKRKTP